MVWLKDCTSRFCLLGIDPSIFYYGHIDFPSEGAIHLLPWSSYFAGTIHKPTHLPPTRTHPRGSQRSPWLSQRSPSLWTQGPVQKMDRLKTGWRDVIPDLSPEWLGQSSFPLELKVLIRIRENPWTTTAPTCCKWRQQRKGAHLTISWGASWTS